MSETKKCEEKKFFFLFHFTCSEPVPRPLPLLLLLRVLLFRDRTDRG